MSHLPTLSSVLSHPQTGENYRELLKGVQLNNRGCPILLPEADLAFHGNGPLGTGSFGVCFLAKQRSLDRFVAVKFLQDKYSSDTRFVEQFKKEIFTLAKCQHRYIVQIYTASINPPLCYYVMEFVGHAELDASGNLKDRPKSQTLDSVLREHPSGKFAPTEVRRLALQILDALNHLHSLQPSIVHRDIKPNNILLTDRYDKRYDVRVADFGLARENAEMAVVTQTHVQGGTLPYAAPEQHKDTRSDIYSLGATLYYMLTGKLAARFGSEHDLPSASWVQLIEGMLRDDPALRLTIDEVRDQLKSIKP